MATIIIFLVAFVSLHALRLRALEVFKGKAATLPPSNGELFKANQNLVHTEVFFVVLVSLSGISSAFLMIRWENARETLSGVLTFAAFIGLTLISCFMTLPMMHRYGSYLKWGEKEIEYNIAFKNRLKDKKLVAISDISQIEECDSSFSLRLKSGKLLLIKKNLLKLLNGWEILFEKFYELKKNA
jgi:hypothetical protein